MLSNLIDRIGTQKHQTNSPKTFSQQVSPQKYPQATDFVRTPTYPTRHTRQFEENLPRGAVPGRIWGNMCFAHILQKELQTSAEKGSLNRPLPFLIFFNSGSLLDPWKSRAQTTSRQ